MLVTNCSDFKSIKASILTHIKIDTRYFSSKMFMFSTHLYPYFTSLMVYLKEAAFCIGLDV